MKADVEILAGRRFTSTSGNRCLLLVLEHGALRATWADEPTGEDVSECNSWAAKQLNADIMFCVGLENEDETLRKFRIMEGE